ELQSPWERRHLACARQAGSLRTQGQARCLRSQGLCNPLASKTKKSTSCLRRASNSDKTICV
ncbi:MAG: hypothetical protein FWC43_14310, partial [Planctomycetaceae bacterium]|nr:hypothetical protein [Planctomycetaceae bacterium]